MKHFKTDLRTFYEDMVCYLDNGDESLLERLKMIPKGNHKQELEEYSKEKLIVYSKMIDVLKSHSMNLRSYYADKIKMMLKL